MNYLGSLVLPAVIKIHILVSVKQISVVSHVARISEDVKIVAKVISSVLTVCLVLQGG